MIAFIALAIWLYLFFAHGAYWRSRPELQAALPTTGPDVDIVVPARDEAASIGGVVASLLRQEYPGRVHVWVVDDGSQDDTGSCAGRDPRLTVMRVDSKPEGWSGKLWALHEGIAVGRAPLLLFADADIEHDPLHLATLVQRLQSAQLGMVSEMVRLNCASLAEKALVPAFVYFFQMLYPFAHVNDPRRATAAAAGGTVLIRRDILERIGGIAAIRGALIDDVSLARAVKPVAPLYLGHSGLARSVRPYPGFGDLWNMVARTAFTQLRYSNVLLVLTLAGLTVVWLVPVWLLLNGAGWARLAGGVAWVLSCLSYLPTLRRYQRNPLWAFALPLIAMFYMGATLASALRRWRGSGAQWKNRAYRS